MTPSEFGERVRAYCSATRASETSGLRTPKHNAAVGGVPNSYHLLGLARDVVYDVHVAEADARAKAAQLGLKLIREGSHDHLQPLTEVRK